MSVNEDFEKNGIKIGGLIHKANRQIRDEIEKHDAGARGIVAQGCGLSGLQVSERIVVGPSTCLPESVQYLAGYAYTLGPFDLKFDGSGAGYYQDNFLVYYVQSSSSCTATTRQFVFYGAL